MLSPKSLKSIYKGKLMKEGLHPKIRTVVFKDISCDFAFLGTTTIDSKEKTTWTDGKEYPLVKVEISSASHPFYTGKQRVMDTEGRIDRFKKKYAKPAAK
jgi:large subunit ribosomal protein L31